MDRLRSELEKILPQNAHKLATGKLFLSATCISDRKNMLLSEFSTREELIQVRVNLQTFFFFVASIEIICLRNVCYYFTSWE